MQCQACGNRKPPLHVHHKTYERFGKELLTDLVGLCDTCHKKVHADHRKNGGSLKFWTDKHIAVEVRKRK
jgi:5-methylcytosine-specific restriction endonuclease McrA